MSGRNSPDGENGLGASPSRPKRQSNRLALKPGSSSASPPLSVDVTKIGGRRARIEASRRAMAANDAKREANDG